MQEVTMKRVTFSFWRTSVGIGRVSAETRSARKGALVGYRRSGYLSGFWVPGLQVLHAHKTSAGRPHCWG